MNKILFFTDSHLRLHGSFPPFNQIEENGFTRELNNIVNGFYWVAAKIREEKPNAVFFTGDLFHTPEGLPSQVVYAAGVVLDEIQRACEEVDATFYLMKGNHDIHSEELGINFVSAFSGYGVYIPEDGIVKVQLGTPGQKAGVVLRIGVVQFSTNEEHVIKRLNELSKKCDMIVTHLDFSGCAYENGWRSESVLPTNFPIPIVSGDIHRAQHVGSVYYTGSLIQNRFTCRDTIGIGGILIAKNAGTDKVSFEHVPNTESFHYVKIEEPEDITNLDPRFKVVLQVKCEIEDRSVLEPYEHIYIPMKKKTETVGSSAMKLNFGTPFSTLKRFVAENKPDAVAALESVIQERAQ